MFSLIRESPLDPLCPELDNLKDALSCGGSCGNPNVDGVADVLNTLPCLLNAPLPPLMLRGFWVFVGVLNPVEDDDAAELLFCLRLRLLPRPRHPPLDPAFDLVFWPMLYILSASSSPPEVEEKLEGSVISGKMSKNTWVATPYTRGEGGRMVCEVRLKVPRR